MKEENTMLKRIIGNTSSSQGLNSGTYEIIGAEPDSDIKKNIKL